MRDVDETKLVLICPVVTKLLLTFLGLFELRALRRELCRWRTIISDFLDGCSSRMVLILHLLHSRHEELVLEGYSLLLLFEFSVSD